MKLSKTAIVMISALTLSGLVSLPVNAAVISGHHYSVSPAATVGSDDSAAIDDYIVKKDGLQQALSDYRGKKKNSKAAKDSFKVVLQQFKLTDKAYSNAKKVIGKTFSDAVKSAKDVFKSETSAATNAEQKLAAKNKFTQAKATAASNRAAALASLGKAPKKPVAPVAKK